MLDFISSEILGKYDKVHPSELIIFQNKEGIKKLIQSTQLDWRLICCLSLFILFTSLLESSLFRGAVVVLLTFVATVSIFSVEFEV